jgi:hypothetical protein
LELGPGCRPEGHLMVGGVVRDVLIAFRQYFANYSNKY